MKRTVNRIISIVLAVQLAVSAMPPVFAESGTQSKLIGGGGNVSAFVRLLTASISLPEEFEIISEEPPTESEEPPTESEEPPVESKEPPVENNEPPTENNENEPAGGKQVGGELSPTFIEIMPLASATAPPYVWVQYSHGIKGLLTAKNPAMYRFDVESATAVTGYSQKTLTGTDSDGTRDYRTENGAVEVRLRFPSVSSMGRVPDMMFDDWYIYGSVQSGSTQPPNNADTATRKYSSGMSKVTGLVKNSDGTFQDLWVRDGFTGTLSYNPAVPDILFYGIQFVANWKKSNNASPVSLDIFPLRATGNVNGQEHEFSASTSALTLYQTDIKDVPDSALGSVANGFTPSIHDYYIRVDGDVEAVDLSLVAFEPYADYMAQYNDQREEVGMRDNGVDGGPTADRPYTYVYSYVNPAVKVESKPVASPVEVTYKAANAATYTDLTNSRLNYMMLNGGIYNEYVSYPNAQEYNAPEILSALNYWSPNNAYSTAAARSVWEIAGYKPENSNWWTTANGRTFDRATTRSYTKTGDTFDIDDSIPLAPTEGGNKMYNTIVVTVTSPDGSTTNEYRIHIQRLRDPSVKLLPGNSPIGVIERDQGTTWGSGDAATANKEAYKDAFLSTADGKQAYQFLKTTSTQPHPTDTINNNNGRLFSDVYTTSAWVKLYSANTDKWRGVANQTPVQGMYDSTGEPLYNYNPDIDQNALFVYQDSGFYDPGFAYLYDTQGNVIDIKNSGTVSRSVKLTLASKLDYSYINPTNRGSLTPVWYTKAGDLVTSETLEVLTTANGKDMIDLSGKNIMPGVYTMEYVFTDPITGRKFDSIGTNFSDETKSRRFEFSRTLVVLPIPGDVDMNGAVTVADAVAYSRLVSEGALMGTYLEGANADTLVAMFARRVIDVNPDGKVLNDSGTGTNQYDYELLEGGYEPQLSKANGASDYFYVPPQRPTSVGIKSRSIAASSVSGGTGRATLSVDFLGVGTAPKASAAAAAGETVKQNDVFWVGVNLSNTAQSEIFTGGAVQNFTFTLNYDNVYLEPATMITEEDMVWAQDMDAWIATMQKFNLRQGANTIWEPAGAVRNFTHTAAMKPKGTLGTHYSKALTELEISRGSINVSELVFSITRASAAQADVAFTDGYLLIVPFRLKQYPSVPEGSDVKLIEMGLGMREFTFVNTVPVAMAPRGIMGFSIPATPYATSNGEAAYSVQSGGVGNGIFGDTTDNLKDSIAYSSYMMSFTLGVDESPRTLLQQKVNGVDRNAVYGDYFSVGSVPTYKPQPSGLPPGLVYKPSEGRIEGTPTKAGTYRFSVGAVPYEIIVEQAALRVYADDKTRYYGEDLFTGMQSFDGTDFLVSDGQTSYQACNDSVHINCGLEHFDLHLTYKYYPCDIKAIDTVDGGGNPKQNRGVITDLMNLIGTSGLNHPELYVVDSKGQQITDRSNVGEYSIISGAIDSTEANYKLIYTNYAYDEVNSRAYGYKPPAEILDYTFGNDTAFDYATKGQPVGRMTITKRPLTVGQMLYEPGETVGEITDELGSRTLAGLEAQTTARVAGEPFGFTAVLPAQLAIDAGTQNAYDRQLITSPDSTTNGLMPGDELYITYAAEFQQDPVKDQNLKDNKLFSLELLRENRDVLIRNIVLDTAKGSASNYRLVFADSASPQVPRIANGGVVVQKPITKLAIISMPKTDLVYGHVLELIGALQISITNGKVSEGNNEIIEDSSSVVNYIYDSQNAYGIDISLVTAFQKEMGWHAQPKLKDGVDPTDPGFNPRDLSNYKTTDSGTLDFEDPLEASDRMVLNVKDSGYYLCVYAETTTSSSVKQILVAFADNPITVTPKPLVLTVQPKSRYYGEPNDGLDFTFSKYDLSEVDRARLKEKNLNQAADNAEFVNLFSSDDTYSAPEMYGVLRHDAQTWEYVDEFTPYTGAYYHVVLTGAATDNYTILYARPGTQTRYTTYGYNNLFVAPRPIIVETVTSISDEQVTIYADANKSAADELLYVRGIEMASDTNLVFRLPDTTVAQNGLPVYYTRQSTTEYVVGNAAFGTLTGNALIGTDKLTITADAAFIPDFNRTGGFNNEVFDLEGGTSKDYRIIIQDLKLKSDTATANNYTLVFYNPSDGVYGTPADTQTVYQNPETKALEPISSIGDIPDFTVDGVTFKPPIYYIAANKHDGSNPVKGTVLLRELLSIDIVGDPNMVYTYGDEFSPWSSGVGNSKFSVLLTYDNKYANPRVPSQQTWSPPVMQYQRQSMNSNDSNFSAAGLEIFFVDSESEAIGENAANRDNQFVYEGRYLPVSYTGKYLRIGGRRHTGHNYIVSDGLSANALQISKKRLPVSAVEQHKYYGENNKTDLNVAGSTYEFTYLISDLAIPDRTKVAGNTFGSGAAAYGVGYVSSNAASADGGVCKTGAAQSASLSLLDGYVGPVFTTNAIASSPVRDYGRSNDYYVNLEGGEMANYYFDFTNSHVRIYRRPIYVSGFNSDFANMANTKPIFTIYNDSGANKYLNDVMYKGIQADDAGYIWFTPQLPAVLSDGKVANDDVYLPPTAKIAAPTGSAIVGTDNIGLGIEITFPTNRTGLSSCEVDIGSIYLGQQAESGNYYLLERNRTYKGYGKIETRDINEITVLQGPVVPLDSYVYGTEVAKGQPGGGSLDLSGLIVFLDYTDSDGAEKTKQITYQGTNAFEAEGLYLRYYPDGNLPYTLSDAQRAAIHAMRRASSGDHLTVSETHQSFDPSSPYTGGAWTANGKYIVLYSRVPGSNNPYTNHQYIYAEPRKDDSSIARRSQIQVAPKVLQYTFAVEDKTYDGTTNAVGSITLTNVFATADGVKVDDYHTNGLQDVVWITTGATAANGATGIENYERTGNNPIAAEYANFYSYIKSKGHIEYTFTSGTFAEATPARDAPMNGKLDYAGKNPYGTSGSLTFRFIYPNVRYEETGSYVHSSLMRAQPNSPLWKNDASRHTENDVYGNIANMPVEILGITLDGPDKENYVFENNSRSISYTYNPERGTWLVTPTAVYVYNPSDGKWTQGSPPPYPIGDISRIPYATIKKASRADIDVYIHEGLVRPVLETDWHTNVVRVLFDTEHKTANSVISRILAADAINNSVRVFGNEHSPIVDAYELAVPEAHIEYALEYIVPVGADLDAGITAATINDYRLVTMNAAGYQDTIYFGGEAYKISWPANFAPDLRNERPPDRNTVFKGQRYKWTLNEEQYLQFDKTTGDQILRSDLWPFDDGFVYHEGDDGGYYTTDRLPLARDSYVWAKVRLSETHNYLPSAPLYSVDNSDDMANYYSLTKNSENFKAAIRSAYDYAADRLALIDANANQSRPNQQPDEEPPAAAVVKTYKYAMPIISVESTRSVLDNQNYLVETLEQVWFTDKSYYFDSRQLDYVFENDLTRRYREYNWDNLGQNRYEYPIELGVEPLPGTEITVNREDANRNRYESYERINNGIIDPLSTTLTNSATGEAALSAAVAERGPVYPVFASTAADESPIERWIKIEPRNVVVELGHEPIELAVEFWPTIVPRYDITWASDDPSIATVDENGRLYFNGVGETYVTATSFFGKTDYIGVTVLPGEETAEAQPGSMIDAEYTGRLMETDGDYYFYPENGMTRSELVVLMAKLFVKQNAPEMHAILFEDLSVDEAYFEAVEMLASAGVVVGVGENMFAGKRLATRAEMATIIARMLGLDVAAYEGVELYSDIGEDETWAGPYISAIADAGITNGTGDGKFNPNRILTRAEAAAFVTRLLTHNTVDPTDEGLVIPVDVPETHWAYDSIIRALNEVILHVKTEDEEIPLE